jgi:hypothetical protein
MLDILLIVGENLLHPFICQLKKNVPIGTTWEIHIESEKIMTFRKIVYLHATAILIILIFPMTTYALPAFPGAEGFGSTSVGGRGGIVCKVNTTADGTSGSCSGNTCTGTFRYCATRSGARTIIFTIGGTIVLTSGLNITNGNLTIAGQTAPGGGIQVRNGQITLEPGVKDVIIRGMRFRVGNLGSGDHSVLLYGPHPPSSANIERVIFDHNSFAYGLDETFSNFGGTKNITLSYNIIANALANCSGCALADHGYGALLQGEGENMDAHHNLFANNMGRNPYIARHSDDSALPVCGEVINNVVYNWVWGAATNGGAAFIGNRFKAGPGNTSNYGVLIISAPPANSVYVSHNVGPTRQTDSGDEWAIVSGSTSYRATNRPCSGNNTVIDDVNGVMADVLANAGAIPRDSMDSEIVSQVQSGSSFLGTQGSFPSTASWPTLSAGTAPTDTDNDGMPDAWEIANGTNPNVWDANGDLYGDGYTNIERWINSFFASGTPSPAPPPQPSLIPNAPSILQIQ